MKLFSKIALAISSLIHLYRIFFPFSVMIGNYEVPTLASIVFLILAIILCIGLWKEAKTK